MPLVVMSSLSLRVFKQVLDSPVFRGGVEMPTFRGTSDKATPDVPANPDSVIPLFLKLINLQVGVLRLILTEDFLIPEIHMAFKGRSNRVLLIEVMVI